MNKLTNKANEILTRRNRQNWSAEPRQPENRRDRVQPPADPETQTRELLTHSLTSKQTNNNGRVNNNQVNRLSIRFPTTIDT